MHFRSVGVAPVALAAYVKRVGVAVVLEAVDIAVERAGSVDFAVEN